MKLPLTFITAFRVLMLSFLCLYLFFSQAIELPQQVQNKLQSIDKKSSGANIAARNEAPTNASQFAKTNATANA